MTPLPRDWNPSLRKHLDDLGEALEQHPRLAGALLFGDLVRGSHRGPQTPIGLALVLEAVGDPADARMADALHGAFVAARVEPWLVLESELPRLADVFPVKLFEIARYGRHLCGRMETLGIDSTPEQLRLRTEQLARNMLMRRRRIALMQRGSTPQTGHAEAASRLRVLVAALDHLQGGDELELVERSASSLGLEADRLHAAFAAEGEAIDEVLAALVHRVDTMTEPSS